MIPILTKIANRFRSRPNDEESGDDVSYTFEIDDIGFITTNDSYIQAHDKKLGLVKYDYDVTYVYDLDDDDDAEDFKMHLFSQHLDDFGICLKKMNEHINKYKDFLIGDFDGHVLLQSELRGVHIIMKNFLFVMEHKPEEVNSRLDKLASLVSEADKNYVIESRNHIDGKLYMKYFKESYDKFVQEQISKKILVLKNEAKSLAKKQCRYKYYVGDQYSLMHIDERTGEMVENVYEVRKVVYTIGSNVVNVVIMKHLSGFHSKHKQLSVFDCKAFHIKYEPELFVFPINMNFVKKSITIKRKKQRCIAKC